jgi:hypothetical protein
MGLVKSSYQSGFESQWNIYIKHMVTAFSRGWLKRGRCASLGAPGFPGPAGYSGAGLLYCAAL